MRKNTKNTFTVGRGGGVEIVNEMRKKKEKPETSKYIFKNKRNLEKVLESGNFKK